MNHRGSGKPAGRRQRLSGRQRPRQCGDSASQSTGTHGQTLSCSSKQTPHWQHRSLTILFAGAMARVRMMSAPGAPDISRSCDHIGAKRWPRGIVCQKSDKRPSSERLNDRHANLVHCANRCRDSSARPTPGGSMALRRRAPSAEATDDAEAFKTGRCIGSATTTEQPAFSRQQLRSQLHGRKVSRIYL